MEAEVSLVRLIGRVFVSLLLVAVIAAAVYGGGPAIRWVLSSQGFGLLSREPMQPVQLSSLNRYTARAAAKPWFRSYFTTMVFDQQRDQTISSSALVTRHGSARGCRRHGRRPRCSSTLARPSDAAPARSRATPGRRTRQWRRSACSEISQAAT
jgi:hypothetical protein